MFCFENWNNFCEISNFFFKLNIWIVILSLCGVLFSGYLSFSKLILGACPLNEGCAYILGLPSCVYGFILFLALFALSIFNLKKKELKKYINYVSLAGIIFAVYSSIIDLFFTTCIGGCSYSLILPSCIYGLVFFVAIFIINR